MLRRQWYSHWILHHNKETGGGGQPKQLTPYHHTRRMFSSSSWSLNTRSKSCLVCGINLVSCWHGLCGNEHPFIPEELGRTVREKHPSTLVEHQSMQSFTDYNQRPEEHQKASWGSQCNSLSSPRCNMLTLITLLNGRAKKLTSSLWGLGVCLF